MKQVCRVTLLCLAGLTTVHARTECESGEDYDRYLRIGQTANAEYDHAKAALNLGMAANLCPSYELYQQLGEVAARLPERKKQRQAVEAFVAAYEIAPTDKARARSLYDYARLLRRDGDPQKAIIPAREALVLDPDNAEIVALNEELKRRVDSPTPEEIVRGWDETLFKPLSFRHARGSAVADDGDNGIGSGLSQMPSAFIPINFVTGSTQVDERTERNVTTLAIALLDPSVEGRTILFIGHADQRGGREENMALSRRRAEAIYLEVISLEGSLQGRIAVLGRGEEEPIDRRNNEEAWRMNRRLEVILK